jgi:hypothetical protein
MSSALLKKCANVLRDVDYLFDELNNEINNLHEELGKKEDEISAIKEQIEELKTYKK